MVDEYLQTSVIDIYAAGDCAEFRKPIGERRVLEQVWYTGRMMGEALAATLSGNFTKYEPGHWFNSAKFFDIEYQTYGWVWAKPRENENDFYWEHPEGKISLRLRWDGESGRLLGVNNFGFRLRHHAFDKWFDQGKTVEYALTHLKDANFDPEFYKKHEQSIIDQFNQQNGTSYQLKKEKLEKDLRICLLKKRTCLTVDLSLSIANPEPKQTDAIQKLGLALAGLGLLTLFLAWGNLPIPSTLGLTIALGGILIGTTIYSYRLYMKQPEGIKNNGVMFKSLTSRGVLGWIAGVILTGFYVIIYFYPEYLGYKGGVGANEGFVALFDSFEYVFQGKASYSVVSIWYAIHRFYCSLRN